MRGRLERLTGLRFRQPQTDEESTIYLLMPTAVVLLSALLTAIAGMTFVLIADSAVHFILVAFSTAMLCILPPFIMKMLTGFIGYSDRAALTVLTALGLLVGLIPVSAYYVSRDYEMSVYRYMKVTPADVYYFGGYDSLEQDYASPDSFMTSMKQTPASVVIAGMSVDRIAKIPPGQLEVINSESLWAYFGFAEILGESSDEVEDSLTASRTMDAYEFTFEYRGLTAKTFTYMLRHPRMTFREIGLISRMGTKYAKPSTLLIFIFGELFGVYMICMHFGLNAAWQLVYYTRPAPLKLTVGFVRLLVGSVREMISQWRINEDELPEAPVQPDKPDLEDQPGENELSDEVTDS